MNYYYKSIASEEMSDFEEFYTKIADLMPDEAWLVECGVADGRSVIMLASLMKNLGKRCKIWAVDNFIYGGDYQRNVFMKNVINSGETNIELMDMSSLDASCRAQDNQFNFVFLDAWHTYEGVRAEITLWSRKVAPGGILAGHDYTGIEDVKRAVDEMVPADKLIVGETTFKHGTWHYTK